MLAFKLPNRRLSKHFSELSGRFRMAQNLNLKQKERIHFSCSWSAVDHELRVLRNLICPINGHAHRCLFYSFLKLNLKTKKFINNVDSTYSSMASLASAVCQYRSSSGGAFLDRLVKYCRSRPTVVLYLFANGFPWKVFTIFPHSPRHASLGIPPNLFIGCSASAYHTAATWSHTLSRPLRYLERNNLIISPSSSSLWWRALKCVGDRLIAC